MDVTGGSTGASVVTPVDHALDQVRVAVEHLVKAVEDGGLDHYDVPQLLGFIAGLRAGAELDGVGGPSGCRGL